MVHLMHIGCDSSLPHMGLVCRWCNPELLHQDKYYNSTMQEMSNNVEHSTNRYVSGHRKICKIAMRHAQALN